MYYELGRYSGAVPAYQTGLTFHPQNAQGWLRFGQCFLKQGNYEESAAALVKAIEIEPGNPMSLYCAAMSFTKSGNQVKGKLLTQQLLDLQPDWLSRVKQNPLLSDYVLKK